MVEDTEEMRKWKRLSHSEMDLCWKNLAGRMEEKVLEKYKVEESKREAFRGGGAPIGMEEGTQKKKKKKDRISGKKIAKENKVTRKNESLNC